MFGTHTYGPFGEPESRAGAAFRWAGRRLDFETLLYYNRARTYTPGLGRFLSPDPIGTKGGLNLYEYAGDDPVNNSDPMGTAVSRYTQRKDGVVQFPEVEITGHLEPQGPADPGVIGTSSGNGGNGGDSGDGAREPYTRPDHTSPATDRARATPCSITATRSAPRRSSRRRP